MNITSSIPATSYQPGLTTKKLDEIKRDIDFETLENQKKLPQVNMRNISYAEILELAEVASEQGLLPDGFAFPLPLPPNPWMSREEYYNYKHDYLGQREAVLAFNRSLGESDGGYAELVATVRKFHSPEVKDNFASLAQATGKPYLAKQQEIPWANAENLEQERLEFLLKTT